MAILNSTFFDQDACTLACKLLGMVIRHKYRNQWLSARIIETEAYYLQDRASHASLGWTQKRNALFMPAGTIYMYYARGKDSLNLSCHGPGNAVLIKSAFPFEDSQTHPNALSIMQSLNPSVSGTARPLQKLCSGQTLLCRSLDLKVVEWDQQTFRHDRFYLDDLAEPAERIIQTTRLGIPEGRDGHLPYRFVHYDYARHCSSNPLTKRGWCENEHYKLIQP